MLGVIDEILESSVKNFKEDFSRRLRQVGLIIYGWGAPEEVGEYLDNAHLCYLHGIFIASMVMAATAIEAALRVKYTKATHKKKVSKRERGRKGEFEYLIEWAKRNSIITLDQATSANKIRKRIRNKLLHIKTFTDDELESIYELQTRGIRDLADAELEILALYSLRTDPSERLARKIIEIADEIVEHIFSSIGRIPFELDKQREKRTST